MDTEKILKSVEETVKNGFNDFMEKSLTPAMEEISVKNARKVVEMALIERSVKGRDITGLDTEQKIKFAKQVQSVFRGNRDGALVMKANEALIEEQDNRGGYLVEPEVAAAILRIAASVGTIMKQCQQWPMKTDELGIPNYTGSFLTGSYVGVDLPGTVTGLTFGQAVLIARKWQLAFTVGNDLLADASVQLADWLMAMAGEALANMVDQQGFVGGTVGTAPGPFVGILNTANVNTYTLGTGSTTYAKFNPVSDAANVIATLEESISLDIDLQITNMQNSVYVIGGTLPVMFTDLNTNDVYPTNGVANTFPVAYAYSSSTIVVELNGTPQSVGVLNQVTDPTTVDVLYSDSGRFIQFTAGAPAGGGTVKIFGTAQVPIVAHASDSASIAAYGERQGVITDSTITSVPEAQLRATAQILQFGHPVYDLKFNTLVPGCQIGQTIKANIPAMGITNYNLVIKRIEMVGWAPGDNTLNIPGQLEYQIECIGSDTVTFTDLMTTILQNEQTQADVSDDTITENLIVEDETVIVEDTITITASTGFYKYGPTSPQPRYGFATYA